MRVGPAAAIAASALLLSAAGLADWSGDPYPTIHPNDNRLPAGEMVDGVLYLDLEASEGLWYPESVDGPSVVVAALGEVGKGPEIPAPLIRVPEGTPIVVRLRNSLDTTLSVYGLNSHPAAEDDSVAIAPGDTQEWRFDPGPAGTYPWGAYLRPRLPRTGESFQLGGALVVDSADGPAVEDRVLVINIWSRPSDSTGVGGGEALAINGKSWPYTERLHSTVGDTVHWRVVNVSGRNHPMHMHGHYYQINSQGDFWQDTTYAPGKRPLVVTEGMRHGHTMSLTWWPQIPGNWLFHCHLVFHVWPYARMTHHDSTGAVDPHAGEQHMAGLVMGLKVSPKPGTPREDRSNPRKLRLTVSGTTDSTLWSPVVRAFSLDGDERSGDHPAAVPGPPLILTQGEPVDVTVINQLDEATGIHWHGLELESYSDGVVGWSGMGPMIAPAIAPGDSFTARLTLRRPGTFMYHSHLNDVEQLSSGMYGAILVLPPGQSYDPATDHTFILGWDAKDAMEEDVRFIMNGTDSPPPITLERGKTHRFRFINIAPAGAVPINFMADSATAIPWTQVALDGADLPPALQRSVIGLPRIEVGETADYAFTPTESGEYYIRFGWDQYVIARQELIVP